MIYIFPSPDDADSDVTDGVYLGKKPVSLSSDWRLYIAVENNWCLLVVSRFPSEFPSVEEDVLQEEASVLHLLLAQQHSVHPLRGGGSVPAPPAGKPPSHRPCW